MGKGNQSSPVEYHCVYQALSRVGHMSRSSWPRQNDFHVCIVYSWVCFVFFFLTLFVFCCLSLGRKGAWHLVVSEVERIWEELRGMERIQSKYILWKYWNESWKNTKVKIYISNENEISVCDTGHWLVVRQFWVSVTVLHDLNPSLILQHHKCQCNHGHFMLSIQDSLKPTLKKIIIQRKRLLPSKIQGKV